MYFLHESVYRLSAIGIMVKDENNDLEMEKRNEQFARFIAHTRHPLPITK